MRLKILETFKDVPIIGSILIMISNILTKYILFFRNRKYIARNNRYKNLYKGKRCFILGNGPSLRQQDISLLTGEIVFTVNNMMTTPEYKKIKPSFHIMADALNFIQEDKALDKLVLGRFTLLTQKEVNPVCIFPVSCREIIEKRGLCTDDRIFYFINYGNWSGGKIDKIDMTSFIPNFTNVVHLGIMAAAYMGFEEIYLLGVDMTSFLVNYEHRNEGFLNDKYFHFYKEDKYMRDMLLKAWESTSNETSLKNMAKAFEQFRYLRIYSEKTGFKIINLTKGGALDVFERKELEEIVNKI